MSVQNTLTRAGYVFAAFAALLAVALLVGGILLVVGAIAPPSSTGLFGTISCYGDASRIGLLGFLAAATSSGLAMAAIFAGERMTTAARTAAAE